MAFLSDICSERSQTTSSGLSSEPPRYTSMQIQTDQDSCVFIRIETQERNYKHEFFSCWARQTHTRTKAVPEGSVCCFWGSGLDADFTSCWRFVSSWWPACRRRGPGWCSLWRNQLKEMWGKAERLRHLWYGNVAHIYSTHIIENSLFSDLIWFPWFLRTDHAPV